MRDEYQQAAARDHRCEDRRSEVVAPEVEAPPKVVNLMEALRKSLDSISASKKLSRPRWTKMLSASHEWRRRNAQRA